MIPLHEALRIAESNLNTESKLNTSNYISETTQSSGNQREWLVPCIYALKKQIAVKPYKGTCPSCGTDGRDEYGRKNYCSNCGQRLNWRDTP